MSQISFRCHRFPADVGVQRVCWSFRLTLGIRDVEELMAERGVVVGREAIRCRVIEFGPQIAANQRRCRSPRRAGRILTKRWSSSVAGGCTAGERSTTRAGCWRVWSRNGEINMRL